VGGGEKSACWQCRHVKAKCSLVGKRGVAPSTPAKPRKRARTGEAGSSKVGASREKEVVADEESEKEDSWGLRACEEIARLSGSLEGLSEMIGRQNALLGRLAGMMEEEATRVAWRRRTEGTSRAAPIVLGMGEEEEVREEVEEKGDEEEEEEEDE
jgi:hypothetical protein